MLALVVVVVVVVVTLLQKASFFFQAAERLSNSINKLMYLGGSLVLIC